MKRLFRQFKLVTLVCLLGCLAPVSGQGKEAEPLFLDMGGFGIYRLNQAELDLLSNEHIQQAYETYVRRYFAAFMYITRNIVSIEVHQGYSPTIVNPIIAEFNMLPAETRRERIYDLYLKPEGLKQENQLIFNRVVKLVDDWDTQKGFPRIQISLPDHDPNDIRKLYLQKLGLPERHFTINTAQVQSPFLIELVKRWNLGVILFAVFVGGLVLGFAVAKVANHGRK